MYTHTCTGTFIAVFCFWSTAINMQSTLLTCMHGNYPHYPINISSHGEKGKKNKQITQHYACHSTTACHGPTSNKWFMYMCTYVHRCATPNLSKSSQSVALHSSACDPLFVPAVQRGFVFAFFSHSNMTKGWGITKVRGGTVHQWTPKDCQQEDNGRVW